VELVAAQGGAQVVGLGRHRRNPGPPGFVLGYGHLSDGQLRRASGPSPLPSVPARSEGLRRSGIIAAAISGHIGLVH
jgi:hypothetical protein